MFTLRVHYQYGEQMALVAIMKYHNEFRNTEDTILDAALKALEDTTGLKGIITRPEPQGAHIPDACVTIEDGKTQYRYAVEVKNVDRVAVLGMIKNQFEALNEPGLLVAPHITAEMAEHCRKAGIQFIDTAGNAYLKAEGLRILVTGRKRNIRNLPAIKNRANTPTGMRVVFSLLCKPELVTAPYRTIARAAGVALGTVGWVMYALRDRGHLLKNGHHLVNTERLIEEWAINYPLQLRPALTGQRFIAPTENWHEKVGLEKYGAVWGGEIAAEMLTQYRKPNTVTVYLPGDPTRLIVDQRLRADPKGNVVILEKFWNFETDMDKQTIVPPLLAYADLMATQDPRNHEVAKIIYERHIANAYY